MSKVALIKAVELADGQVALAAAIRKIKPASKVSQAHIWKWLNRAQCEVPPAEYVIPICDAVGWRITPHDLRRDLYPNQKDGLPDSVFACLEKVSPADTAVEKVAA